MMPGFGRNLRDRLQRETMLRLKALRHRLVARQPGQRLLVFVTGVHRSGTNMMMEILERSWDTDVFNEADARAFDNHIMKDTTVVRALADRSAARVVVVKALHESHALRALLDEFAPAKAIWTFRDFDDVINSSLHHWPGWRNKIEKLVEDRNAADWRGAGMTDATYRIVREYYRPGLSDAAAIALFWFYRNQLLFDQGLERDERVLLVRYEDLAGGQAAYAKRLADALGLEFTKAMRRVAHAESVRKHAPPALEPGVRELCETMQRRLQEGYLHQMAGLPRQWDTAYRDAGLPDKPKCNDVPISDDSSVAPCAR